MTCRWDSLLKILPPWLGKEVDGPGKLEGQELRLRINAPPELVTTSESVLLPGKVVRTDISYCINSASRYSPWAAETEAMGYLTAEGGHRIGLCGLAVCRNGRPAGIRQVSSLCIRIARDHPGIASSVENRGSILILGAPGWGKTTLLRDLARARAELETVAVVDERGELFPQGFSQGRRMDVLTGMGKGEGIDRVLRTMGPQCIAVDEITAACDCAALEQAAGCGVCLLASAHAGSMKEFLERPLYRPLAQRGLFDSCLVLRRDKTFTVERMKP